MFVVTPGEKEMTVDTKLGALKEVMRMQQTAKDIEDFFKEVHNKTLMHNPSGDQMGDMHIMGEVHSVLNDLRQIVALELEDGDI